mmetsp:Transcript_22816/g.31302  ORF Transcript_22816/g.31302 Transcript_22816/m.31302 type:complete len:149 (+) Transcript_22816:56-502(+)
MSLTDQQISEAFQLFDYERRGELDIESINFALRGLGIDLPQNESLESWIQEIGLTDSKSLDLESFMRLVKLKMVAKDSPEEIRKAFELFDLDHQGAITLENLKAVSLMLGESTDTKILQDMIKEADRDGDGKVSFDEFKAVMEQMREK